MGRISGAASAREPQLPPRQRDLLRLIVKGQRIDGYKYEMMEALGVTSAAELVRYALDRRLYVE